MPVGINGNGTLSGVDLTASGFGKVLQVVRATDTTQRSTSSTSFVDVTGMSVTITPKKSDSFILIWALFIAQINASTQNTILFQLTDSSNNSLSGAQGPLLTQQTTTQSALSIVGYATPAVTTSVTYKMRFRVTGNSGDVRGDLTTSQIYAIEVAA